MTDSSDTSGPQNHLDTSTNEKGGLPYEPLEHSNHQSRPFKVLKTQEPFQKMLKHLFYPETRCQAGTRARQILPQFPKAFLKETAFRLLMRQSQCSFVRLSGIGRSSQATAQVSASGVGQVVLGQIAPVKDVID